MANMGMDCCHPIPEHLELFRCSGVSLACSILTFLGCMLASLCFFFVLAPVGAMGIVLALSGLVIAVSSCVFQCCSKPNTGRKVMMAGSALALVLAIIGILLIFVPSNVCKEVDCYGVEGICSPCVGDGCKITSDEGDTGVDGQSIKCHPKGLEDVSLCQEKVYCCVFDVDCREDLKSKDDKEKAKDLDDGHGKFWGFTKESDCTEWAYDEMGAFSFGFLLVFIFFPVMFLTACITGIFAYRAPTVQEEGDKETPAPGEEIMA